MKKFTFTFLALFCLLTVFAQDQEAGLRIEAVWNNSIGATEDMDNDFDPQPGVLPSYLGGMTERDLAVYDNKLYIPSRKDGNQIAVVDAMTGEFIKYIACPEDVVTGGTYGINTLHIDEEGMMLMINLTTASSAGVEPQTVRGYKADLNDANPVITLAFEYSNPNNLRFGDGTGMYGYVDDGQCMVIIPSSLEAAQVLVVRMNNGQVTSMEELECDDIAAFGTSAMVVEVTEDGFTIDSNAIYPTSFKIEGNKAVLVETLTPLQDGTPNQGIASGAFFTYNDKKYFLTSAGNIDGAPLWAKDSGHEGTFELMEVPVDGISGDMEFVAFMPDPTKEMGLQGKSGTRQTTHMGPVTVDVREDAVYMYMLWPSNGVACYKMYYYDPVNISTVTGERSVLYPNPATNLLNITGEVALVEIFSVAGQKVVTVANENVVNVENLQGIYLVKITEKSGKTNTVKVSIK